MKICLIAPAPPPYGGIANWQQLVMRYAASQPDVELIPLNTAGKRRTTEGRNLFDRVVISGLQMLSLRRQLRRLLRDEAPDAIHMVTSGSLAVVRDLLLLKTAARRKIPVVYHLRFGRVPEIAEKNTLEWRLLRRAMKAASAVVAIDAATHRTIAAQLPQLCVTMLPNPVDASALPKAQKSQKNVVFLGWVVPTKGVEELIDAWNRVGESYPDRTLLLIGPCAPDYQKSLQARCRVSNLRITGEMEHADAMRVLAEAELFVLPSHTEGFPNVVLEAMALGLPVLATPVGAVAQMLAEDCGRLVPVGNAEALGKAMQAMLADEALQKRLGQNAQRRALAEYDIRTVFARYLSLWDSVQQSGHRAQCEQI